MSNEADKANKMSQLSKMLDELKTSEVIAVVLTLCTPKNTYPGAADQVAALVKKFEVWKGIQDDRGDFTLHLINMSESYLQDIIRQVCSDDMRAYTRAKDMAESLIKAKTRRIQLVGAVYGPPKNNNN